MSDLITSAEITRVANHLTARWMYDHDVFTACKILRDEAKRLDAEERQKREAEELAELGGTGSAERGWVALKLFKPSIDGVEKFDDLSHKKKLEYAAFAQGVLEGSTPLPAESEIDDWEKELLGSGKDRNAAVDQEQVKKRFPIGAKVRITGPKVYDDPEADFVEPSFGDVAKVVDYDFGAGLNVLLDDGRMEQYVAASSLSRIFEKVTDIPDGVEFVVAHSDGTPDVALNLKWKRSGDGFMVDNANDPHEWVESVNTMSWSEPHGFIEFRNAGS